MVASAIANIAGPGQPKKYPAGLRNTLPAISNATAAKMLNVGWRIACGGSRAWHQALICVTSPKAEIKVRRCGGPRFEIEAEGTVMRLSKSLVNKTSRHKYY